MSNIQFKEFRQLGISEKQRVLLTEMIDYFFNVRRLPYSITVKDGMVTITRRFKHRFLKVHWFEFILRFLIPEIMKKEKSNPKFYMNTDLHFYDSPFYKKDRQHPINLLHIRYRKALTKVRLSGARLRFADAAYYNLWVELNQAEIDKYFEEKGITSRKTFDKDKETRRLYNMMYKGVHSARIIKDAE